MEVNNKLGENLGHAEPGIPGKQWLITNEHGVKSVISDDHLKRMQWEARISKHYAEVLKSYTIEEVTGEGELADTGNAETSEDTPSKTKKGGKKADTGNAEN